jgi:lysophospholipid acyltransferase (LPLAT)-like uncharacterized protein
MRLLAPLLLAAGPGLGAWGVRLLARSLRIRVDDEMVMPLWLSREPLIYAVWHSQILLMPPLYARFWARWFRPCALTSRSQDGEILARFLVRFGFDTVRGSSSRGGGHALRALARSLREGRHVVVVPDGPRGPCEVVKPGIVTLARLTGAPIVPVVLAVSAEWRLRSWDALRIPKPFARCVLRAGKPLRVPRDAEPVVEKAARRELEAALTDLSREAHEETMA